VGYALAGIGGQGKRAGGYGYFLEKGSGYFDRGHAAAEAAGQLIWEADLSFFQDRFDENRVALELGHAGEPEGAVVLAEEQTAGRGRAGHSWHSERATGIYATVLLRPRLAPVQAPY